MMRRPPPFPLPPSHPGGFTLVEMIVVIVLTGIIGGIVALFIRAPVQGYVESARRAELTDIADTASRRMARDLRLALPNSIRTASAACGASTCSYLDFLSTTGGGRYRVGPGGTNDVLDFTAADTSFEVLGMMPLLTANDQIVVYNLGTSGADAYLNDNRATYSAHAGGVITLAGGKQFPFASPSQRFQVVREQVRYICDPSSGNLTRYWWSASNIIAPSATVPSGAGVSSALLATRISACSFAYDASVVAQRAGLVTLHLTLTANGESVPLYHATHVSNVP